MWIGSAGNPECLLSMDRIFLERIGLRAKDEWLIIFLPFSRLDGVFGSALRDGMLSAKDVSQQWITPTRRLHLTSQVSRALAHWVPGSSKSIDLVGP